MPDLYPFDSYASSAVRKINNDIELDMIIYVVMNFDF